MALTISTHPSEVITNAPNFTVTTSLTEGASYQNLRVRATIYVGGQTAAVAILEQPKGVNNWDFFEILKSFCGKCNHAAGGSDIHIGPTPGSQLITSWGQYEGVFTTFTTSGRQITAAITTGSYDYAESNDLGAGSVGDLWVFLVESNFVDTGTYKAQLNFAQSDPYLDTQRNQYAGLSGGALQANHVYFMMSLASDATPRFFLGNDSAGTNFNGTFAGYKISDFKNNPGAYFKIKFEEVYEDASNVTTVGASAYSDCLLFIPVKVREGESFATDYLIDGNSHKFLSRLEDGDGFYKHGVSMELRPMWACVSAYVRASTIVDAGTNTQNDIPNMGWGMICINSEGGFTYDPDAEDATIGFTLASIVNGGGIIYTGASMNVTCDLSSYFDARCLSFVGDLGEEIILFRGLHSETGNVEKSYYRDVTRMRKILKAYRSVSLKLRALYETVGVRRLIHELLYSEFDVWLFDSDFTDGYRVVTPVDDEAVITDKNELIEAEVTVEYYE